MYSLQLGFGRKRRWSRQQPAQSRRGKVQSIPQCRAVPSRCEWCGRCGFKKEGLGLCACSFMEMDPFEPASALAVTPLAPSNCGQGSFAELELSAWPHLGKGEGVELRMCSTSHPGHHLWPHSMRVLLDGRELARVNPQDNQRRPDSPLKLQPPDKAGEVWGPRRHQVVHCFAESSASTTSQLWSQLVRPCLPLDFVSSVLSTCLATSCPRQEAMFCSSSRALSLPDRSLEYERVGSA